MTAPELETYLHEHIPLSAAMQLAVEGLGEQGVTLSAPLAPNVNHRNSVFGGSLASLATLAGWSLVHVGLSEIGLPSRVVVMSSQIEYLAPAVGPLRSDLRAARTSGVGEVHRVGASARKRTNRARRGGAFRGRSRRDTYRKFRRGGSVENPMIQSDSPVFPGRGSQVVRQGSAKSSCAGSIPARASLPSRYSLR